MKVCPACRTEYASSVRLCETCGEMLEIANPEAGVAIGGRYRLEKLLGEGGMGVVYCAEHISLGKKVALKFLRGQMADDPVVLKRFQREARAAGSIDHPGIVAVTDFGEDGEHGCYYAMEYVPGHSLATILAEQGPFTPLEAARIGSELADTLFLAHQHGIIHRDLKPENIIMASRPGRPMQPKILDFGIAAFAADEDGARLTRTGSVFGTPAYMSPEQAMGQRVDERSDIYALGVVLYELVAGRPPFVGDDMLSTLEMVRSAPPEPPSRIQPGLAEGMESAILRCLQKSPDDRFQSMAEIRDTLRLGQDVTGETVLPDVLLEFTGTTTAVPDSTTELTQGEVGQGAGQPGGRRGLVIGVSAAAVAAAGVATAMFLVSGGQRSGAVRPAAVVGPASSPLPGEARPAKGSPAVFARLLRSDPDGGEVYEDARFIGRTPLKVELADGVRTRALEIRLAGHSNTVVQVDRNSNDDLVVRLRRAGKASKKKKAKRRTKSGKKKKKKKRRKGKDGRGKGQRKLLGLE